MKLVKPCEEQNLIRIVIEKLLFFLDMDSKGGKRGREHCPKCSAEYFNPYKSKEYLSCGEFIGGLHTSEKKPKSLVHISRLHANTSKKR